MADMPELKFTKTEIYEKLKETIAQKLPQEESKNPHLAAQLKNLKGEDVLIEFREAAFHAGYLRINCTAEGFRRYDDGSYMQRTMNDEVDSAEWLFCTSGANALSEDAKKLTGIDYCGKTQSQIAKAVAENYCRTQLQNLNMTMRECRVNSYRFIETKPEFEVYGWYIHIAYTDEKGKKCELFCGRVCMDSLQNEEQHLSLWLTLPLCNAEKRKKAVRTAANVLYNLLFILSLAAYVINCFMVSRFGTYLHLAVPAVGIVLFVCAKLTHKRAKIFFISLSFLPIAAMIAGIFFDILSFLA